MRARGRAALCALVATALVPGAVASAQSTSPDVEHVRTVPFDLRGAIGAKRVDRHLYLTGTRALSIYDVSNPLDPALVSHTPVGYQWQNEDVSTNGRILLVSETLPVEVLHVWDVSDPRAPREIGRGLLAGDHTTECLHDCAYAYGSEGTITDLRDPANPRVVGDWMEKIGLSDGSHDVEEIRPGLAMVATLESPFLALDVRDPLEPRVIGSGEHPAPSDWILHQVAWANAGTDSLVVVSAEGGEGPILTFRVGGTPDAPTFAHIDSYTVGSTSHWFDVHPAFRDGGLLAVGWYGQGTRFLRVSPEGMIDEVGFFRPSGLADAPATWAAYWITDEIVYSVDNNRGIDVLRWKGEIPAPALEPPASGMAPAAGSPAAGDGRDALTALFAGTRRALHRGGLRRVRSGRRLAVAFDAPNPGEASLTLRAGRTRLARGKVVVSRAGPSRLTLRPTLAGRRVLRRRTPARVWVDMLYVNADGGAYGGSRALELRRR